MGAGVTSGTSEATTESLRVECDRFEVKRYLKISYL
jgi:hypothetical protein